MKFIEKINTILEKHFLPRAYKIANQKHINSIKDGVLFSIPFIIIGSIFLVVGFLPIPGFEEFMAKTFGDMWLTKLLYPVDVTFGMVSIIVSLAVAYRLAEKYSVDPLAAALLSLMSFLLVTPFKITGASETLSGIPLLYMGSHGMFVAIIVAIVSTEIFRKVIQKGWVIKMPESVPPAVSKSFSALIPFAITITSLWILRLGIEATSVESIHQIVAVILGRPLSALGNSLIGAIVAVLIIHLLWVVGIHGASVVSAVTSPIWLSLMDQNRLAFQAGEVLPNIITQQFFDVFIYTGGAGGTLAFVCLMAFKAKSEQLKSIGKLSLVPGLFNINEPVIFGVPILMNPIILIPFIISPIVNVIIVYTLMNFGVVAKTAGIAVPWTSPIFISGFLATGGAVSALVLQGITFMTSLTIYYPFFKAYDTQKLKEEAEGKEEVKLSAI